MNIFKIFAILGVILFMYSCQEEGTLNNTQPTGNNEPAIISGTFYDVVLLPNYPMDNGDGTYTWIWSITNTNPGAARDGKQQNLSHWDISLGTCGATIADVVSGAYGTDLDNLTPFSPVYSVDPSQNCYTNAVLKFDYGTSGSVTSYYKLVLNKKFSVDPAAMAVFKWATVCVTGYFDGIGCPEEEKCSEEGTAWGAGTQFNNGGKGNWAYYMKVNTSNLPQTFNLLASQTYDAGSVNVSISGNVVTVTYDLDTDWEMIQSHVHFGTKLSDIPQTTNKQGIKNPIPGLFDYSEVYNPYSSNDSFSWTLPDGYTGDIYIAAHAHFIHWIPCIQ